jgi:hypothetical protein
MTGTNGNDALAAIAQDLADRVTHLSRYGFSLSSECAAALVARLSLPQASEFHISFENQSNVKRLDPPQKTHSLNPLHVSVYVVGQTSWSSSGFAKIKREGMICAGAYRVAFSAESCTGPP